MSYPRLTAQQTFDTVLTALRKQRVKAVPPGSTRCYYRAKSEDGTVLKCAVGHLIPDEEFSEVFNNLAINLLPPHILDLLGYEDHRLLLGHLMSTHDMHLAFPGSPEKVIQYELREWEGRMEQIAGWCSLVYTPPAQPNPT